MISSASKKDVLLGYFSQFLNIGYGIIIIPIAARCLSSSELGLWYLFISIAALIQLLELGFQPTISRMTSYIYSGADELIAEGIPERTGNSLNVQLLFDLISASKQIYLFVSSAAAFILLFVASAYLDSFDEFGISHFIAWIIYASSIVINLYFTFCNGLLIGRGDQSQLYLAVALSKVVMLTVSIPMLFFNMGLLSMAVGSLISTVSFRFLLNRAFRDNRRSEIGSLLEIKKIKKSYVKVLWLSAWKLGLTSIGSFLILRSNMFIASSFIGLKSVASYGLTMQVIGLLSAVSCMYFNLNMPKITSLQTYKCTIEIRYLLLRSMLITYVFYIAGSLGLIFVGVPILDYLKANTNFLEVQMLTFALIVFFLELNHSVCATYLTTKNKVPFLYASLFSGVSVVCLSLLFAGKLHWGLWGLLLSQGLVQLVFNNWYWPLATYRDLTDRHNAAH